MSLFEVDGWTIKTAPVREANQRLSKKRRHHFDYNQTEFAEDNVEKLMEKLTGLQETSTSSGSRRAEEYQGPRKKKKHIHYVTKKKEEPSCARGSKSIEPVTSSEILDCDLSPKKTKHQHERGLHPPKRSSENPKQKTPCDTFLTPLQKGMKESLGGARFRLVCYLFPGKMANFFLQANQ